MAAITTRLATIVCSCGGRGEIQRPTGDADVPVAAVRCRACHGAGTAICSAFGCLATATLVGTDGEPYCTVADAFAERAWPACGWCLSEPVDPTQVSFCSAACAEACLGQLATAALSLGAEPR